MRRAADLVATRVALRGVFALLFAVVAVVCVSARAAHHDSAAPVTPASSTVTVSHSAPVQGAAAEAEPAGDDDAAPCGKKAVTDHGAQRAEAGAHPPLVPSPLQPDPLTAPTTAHGGPGSSSAGPAPPPASPSPSVLRL
ncbi:hypothetical protein [Streptomyces tagetis]|uniref:Secreted protein n=1 Tax=Streptomyces tagetis TaxID=2820809 RepID=A0A940XGL0_9ACTN|nr:hypothetical protein [Streptomyces sp. RG38]MBQ0826206.1 hypothetical protein [Streptomyces sp. RG38]